ncbi:hypothetical protein K491DRAFT_611874 [Lophiostoma macrostomum CBS 122681]|uniref:SnoaL-like domain-containing protein n=1 Tax=Lophiostoma macrostomum CBS 122681 TaxID=1314788 RepID=A0A6A6SM25_9PLEO|nr:hypothetical protein K491DRAFT_611874 [Lophiostoma macrostomum CBS 122681]
MAVTEASLQQLAEAFILGFKTLVPEDLIKLRSPDCQHIFAPSSLNFPSPKSNQEFEDHLKSLLPVLSSFPVTPKEILINEPKRQITIWATAIPHFKDEVKGGTPDSEWEYQGEYIFILDVNEEGKIKRIVEFLDSLGTAKLVPILTKAKETAGM